MMYKFYYQHKYSTEKIVVDAKECIKPQRTNVYKELQIYFNRGLIDVYGVYSD